MSVALTIIELWFVVSIGFIAPDTRSKWKGIYQRKLPRATARKRKS